MTEEETNTINALGYIWSQCALEVIPAKTYVRINKIFEEKLKTLLKESKYVR